MNELDDYVQFAVAFARNEARQTMLHYFNTTEKGIKEKTDRSPVTDADTAINDALIAAVQKTYPGHGVLGEEASAVSENQRDVWVCDPIDGTAAFILGLPTAMFSLAFVRDGEPLIGIAYDPFLDRLFAAIKGKGAFCNDMPVHIESHALSGAFVAGPSTTNGMLRAQSLYQDLMDHGAIIPTFPGNVYKCTLLAEGKIHGRIFGGPGAHDIAAIKVIVEEAGGKVTDLAGNEQRYDRPIKGAIISNGTIHDDLVATVERFGGVEKAMAV